MKQLIAAIALVVALTPCTAFANFDNPTDIADPIGRSLAVDGAHAIAAHVAGIAHGAADASARVDEPAIQCEDARYYAPSYAAPGSAAEFRSQGVVNDGAWTYTWYSQNVLPGTGLDIPGRHVNGDGFVCDANGNICVANSDLPRGATVQTPWGQGVVYDSGCASGVTDVYTNF